jgi:hypothetical protein
MSLVVGNSRKAPDYRTRLADQAASVVVPERVKSHCKATGVSFVFT